ncbi:MAG TPA: hypothetical protein VJB14_00400 [Planctomycetota bacterium]|nr:hypothetical protein [Planctomycetota bacterium]
MHVSLKDAARRTGIPEEQLRRRILTGELAAQTVDDDRQYLVKLEDLGIASPPAPPVRSGSPFFFLKVAFGLFLLLVTAAIVMPRMVPRHPGISCCVGGPTLAQELHRRGIVEAASKVDPEGAAEMVRWALGRARPVKGLWEKASFATKEEFRAWFDALRRYVPDRESR